jgi:imidazolonepropionase-like amidohydrolase
LIWLALAVVSLASGFGVRLPAATQSDVRQAIRDARIVTMAGPPIERGSIVMRDGLIEEVGASVTVPPEAIVIDGAGLTVYPGFIDMANTTAVEAADAAAPARGAGGGTASLEDQERVRRAALLRPDFEAARAVRVEGAEMRRLASAGITSVLAVPSAGLIRGQSALINVLAPPPAAHIGVIADYRRGLVVLKAPVAQHFSFSAGGGRGGGGYPGALLGTMAFVRQALYDARWQRDARAYGDRHPDRPRPLIEPSLDTLAPVVDGRLPAAFEANLAVEISRVLDMAKEFTMDPIIVGGAEAGDVAAAIGAARGRVIYSLDFPVAPPAGRGRGGAPPDEAMRAIRARQNAPKGPAALQAAGVPFAFTAGDLQDLSTFLRNAARTVTDGKLPGDAALAALTVGAARIAGVDNRLGTIQKGRIANVVVTDGDWLNDRTRIRHVFIDGRPVDIEATPAATGGGGRRGGGGGRGAPPQP